MTTKRTKQPAHISAFATRDQAWEYMVLRNKVNRMPGWLWVVTEGPANDWAVVDLGTAIEMGARYAWSVR